MCHPQITFQYENDLLEELALNTLDRDECASNKTDNSLDRAIVNGIQEKLFRLELNYAKRLKVQEICYKKKLDDFQHRFKEYSTEMDVSKRIAHTSFIGMAQSVDIVFSFVIGNINSDSVATSP